MLVRVCINQIYVLDLLRLSLTFGNSNSSTKFIFFTQLTYSLASSPVSVVLTFLWDLSGNESTTDAGAGLETMDRESETGWR